MASERQWHLSFVKKHNTKAFRQREQNVEKPRVHKRDMRGRNVDVGMVAT